MSSFPFILLVFLFTVYNPYGLVNINDPRYIPCSSSRSVIEMVFAWNLLDLASSKLDFFFPTSSSSSATDWYSKTFDIFNGTNFSASSSWVSRYDWLFIMGADTSGARTSSQGSYFSSLTPTSACSSSPPYSFFPSYTSSSSSSPISRTMSKKHVYDSSEGLVLKSLRGAVKMNPGIRL